MSDFETHPIGTKDRIDELEWLVRYVINGLDDWSNGEISNTVFFTNNAAKRVRMLAEKNSNVIKHV